MFDNNQNFNNNPKPLFANDFNNMNQGSQSEDSSQNVNMGFENSVPSNNFFANDFYNPVPLNNNSSINLSFDENSLSADIPPELGEIKNLSDATVASAPTMDVLGPMNVMPENPNFNNDPITAYENGNINLSQPNDFATNFNVQANFNGLNQNINSDSETSSFDFNLNNNFSPTFNNLSDNNYDSVNESAPSLSNFEVNNEFENNISNFNYDEPVDFNLPVENSFNLPSSLDSQEPKVDIPVSASIDENNDLDYTIVQDKIIEENKTDPSILDLNDSYDEEDTLDIMDFEEDNVEESAPNGIIEQEKPLLMDNVEKIKKLIMELKNSGVDIELEEYDFEHMYQLIVKINK